MNRVVLDPKNINGLRRFFHSYGHLSTNDQAQIAHISARTIRRLRKRAGLAAKATTARPPANISIQSIPTVEVPDNWRHNLPWLERMTKIYNVCQLARMVGLSRSTLLPILKKRKLSCMSLKEATKSKNKCCTHAWCYRYYVELALSQRKCAALAGVGHQNFSDWLNRFNIPVRDAEQTMNKRTTITLWEKELIAQLRKQPTVRRVYIREGHIHVRYMNYFWETYYTQRFKSVKRPYTCFRINSENSTVKKPPLVYPEYGVDAENKAIHPAHICISRYDLEAASLMERRLAIHEYARQLVTRGWIWPSFPSEVLMEDFDRVQNADLNRYIEKGRYTIFPRTSGSPPGRKLMMHFFDMSILWEHIKRPKVAIRVLNKLETKTVKFNYFNFLLLLVTNEKRVLRTPAPAIPDPVVYLAIFKRLGLRGTLLDINVGFGNRAIAAAAAGLRYTTPDPSFNFSIERGFPLFTGLEYDNYSGQKVDVALYDEGFRQPDMTKVLPFLNSAKTLMVFCPYGYASEVMKYRPRTAIRIRTRLYGKHPDYIFMW